MSSNRLEEVKAFLIRFVKDESFRDRLQNSSLEESGYLFSKEEFETAAIALLELKEKNEFQELTEEELAMVVGGVAGDFQPMYGAVIDNPKPSLWHWQFPNISFTPLPIMSSPWRPPTDVQPMYGVVVSEDA